MVIVRAVDFPNAGLRSFSWAISVGLTLMGGFLILLGIQAKTKWLHYMFAEFWALFTMVWFGAGMLQIADGLL